MIFKLLSAWDSRKTIENIRRLNYLTRRPKDSHTGNEEHSSPRAVHHQTICNGTLIVLSNISNSFIPMSYHRAQPDGDLAIEGLKM